MSTDKKNQFFDRVKKYVGKEDELSGIFMERENLGWDLKFQNYWGHIIKSYGNGEQKNNQKISELFIAHIGLFRKTAQSVVVSIINELHKSPSERVHHEIQIKNEPFY